MASPVISELQALVADDSRYLAWMSPQEPTSLPHRVTMPWPRRLLARAIAWLSVLGSTLTDVGLACVQLVPGNVMLAASPDPPPNQPATSKPRPATAHRPHLLPMSSLPRAGGSATDCRAPWTRLG